MDKITSITVGLLIIILAVFIGTSVYTGYVETAYRNTITGTYTYTCTITTDSSLNNVTLFIPVPADRTGNSPMVSGFSSRTIQGVPADWETTLYDTGKSTMIKIVARAIVPPQGTTASHPYTITISSETISHSPMNTSNPVEKSAVFRPVQALRGSECQKEDAGGSSRCFTYTTSVYADYRTSADTTVTIASAVTGKNTWKISGPGSNEYHTDITLIMRGEKHGWAEMAGRLSSSIGTYDFPFSA